MCQTNPHAQHLGHGQAASSGNFADPRDVADINQQYLEGSFLPRIFAGKARGSLGTL